ncbi:glycosyltransferase [Neisseria animalis]|uniref:Glycosyltransferase family 4 protein n=1 Tax=Neisseria animalis TaxID=492 RepID=A0A5P3MPZ5_NEIAN|nr:glycosyltransferase [Neisseria animalis]QEY23633.1 glycosyltransferase family 4 protein [Neisseria animalis]ROW32778.1 glycosyltransferase family 4 protein [Neisseria animalis]VEE09381.1 putative glycosyl transferase [Neisseria animalis]
MHILIIPSWYPQSPTDVNGIFFRLQAQALQRAGHKVGVIAGHFRSLRQGIVPVLSGRYGIEHFTEQNVPTYIYHHTAFFPRLPPEQRAWLKAGRKLFERYTAEHGMPDILHAHCINQGGIMAADISRRHGIPYIVTEHSSTYARGMIRSWQRPSMYQAAQGASARLAVSRHFAQLLEREYPGLDWAYLPNLLAPHFEQEPPAPRPADNADGFTFCTVAHLNPNKGFDILLQAFATAKQQRPALKLDIGGGGAMLGRLQNLSAQLGLQDSVRFLGAMSHQEVLTLMRQSHAFVSSSHIETFGVVLIEALSQGLPVVATRSGGPESIVRPDNGILAECGNPESLARAMIALYDRRSRYPADLLRRQTLAEFGEAAVIGRLQTILQTASGKSQPVAEYAESTQTREKP